MLINVSAFASLRKYLPGVTEGETRSLQVAAGATPRQIALELGLPVGEVYVVMRNHLPASLDEPLADGDRLVFLPLLDGG